ncbi:beta-phosphoglucomutase [Clostridia bacterium]|nr:beta-phosphoglucomutase [Clostridia bacterium]
MKRLAIFDLDGVLADTAIFHYLAWKTISDKLGFEFTEKHNERLKGVSRGRSLEILLEVGGITGLTEEEKRLMCEEKNELYVSYAKECKELLSGARECLMSLKSRGVKIALGSASKNARLILDSTGVTTLFDSIVDGTRVKNPKPDPEVFLLAAMDLGIYPADCAVFEDAQAGIDAANAAKMTAVAVGMGLTGAAVNVPSVADFDINLLF